MENGGSQHVELPHHCTFKVHSLLCLELKNLVDRILQLYSAIESSRPRCGPGIEALCSLQAAMDKATLLIQYCSESSKLYLAITADKILSRCKNIQLALGLYLGQIKNNVPTLLAAKISGIVQDLRVAKLPLQSSEYEAGKILLALLRQGICASASINNSELQPLRLAALRLKITSPSAVLMEKGCIKRLLVKVNDTDKNRTKKNILKYLLYLLRKYGKLISKDQFESSLVQSINSDPDGDGAQNDARADDSATPETPEGFKCPMSERLMYDPVIIASGKTYERFWIEIWFSEGGETCPMTGAKLENLSVIPNLVLKGLISQWCSSYGITIPDPAVSSRELLPSASIASFGSAINDLRLQVTDVSLRTSNSNSGSDLLGNDNNVGPRMNADICTCHSSSSGHNISLPSLSKLASLPWESQCKAVQDVKELVNKNEQACDCTDLSTYVKPLIKFLKDAHNLSDVNAQEDSAEVLLAILSRNGTEMPPIDDDSIYALASFLDSIPANALGIMEVLSHPQFFKSSIVASGVLPSILKIFNTQIREFLEPALKILCNLSCNPDAAHHIVYLDYIPKLVPFLGDSSLAGYCLNIMNNLRDIEEGAIAIIETSSCITSIAKVLETGTRQEQETALELLHSLCYEDLERCLLLIGDTINQCVSNISENGSPREKVIATELLQLLGHNTEADASDCSSPNSSLNVEISGDSLDKSEGKRSTSKVFGYLGRKISRFLT